MSKQIGFGASRMRFKKFDMKDICEHATIAMIARRASGKSWLVRELMYHKREIPASVIISKTEKLNKFFGHHVPSTFIYNEFETEILSKIFLRQKRLNDENEKRRKNRKHLKDDRLMLIMDDCMSDKGWVKDPNIGELFFNGRHYHISFILTLQYSKGLPPDMRSNLDYIFLLADDVVANRERLYKDYAGMFPNFQIFDQVFLELTDNYGCMVINNRVHSKNIEDKVFWYKAKKVDDFNMGDRRYKNYHKEYFDKNWDKKIPIFNFQSLMAKKRKGLNLIVEKGK